MNTIRKLMLALWLALPVAAGAQDAPAESGADVVDVEADASVEPAPLIAVEPLAQEPTLAPAAPEEGEAARLDEVMVTANKRKENARTLAGAVTAVGRERLDETGASNFGEYLSLSPGVNYNSGVPGYSVVTIRGVSSDTTPGLSQTAVGIYYDDIPLTDPAAPLVVPDIDAFDAERIELLRGPQGALYGSASMGGAVNYIPQGPNLFNTEYAVQATGNLATNSTLGGSGKLMLNTPLSGTENGLGLRLVGHYTHTPGYIDNVGLDREGSNESSTGGGRVILGWAPTLDSEVRLSGLYQRTEVQDSGYVDESLGDLKKFTNQLEPSDNEIRLASLRYEREREYGSWAFIAGYQDKGMALSLDGGAALGLTAVLGPLDQRLILDQTGAVSGYSAELRFVSPPGERFDWLAGVSYANRDENFRVVLDAASLADAVAALTALSERLNLPLVPGLLSNATLFRQDAAIQAPETALFVDGTWRITPELKLTAGGRGYRNQVQASILARGTLVAPGGSLVYRSQRTETASGFNPKISLAWQASDELMVYGLYSKGYRLGGPNLVPSTVLTPTELTYGPDELFNYEVGIKTGWFDGALTVDVAGFLIDWHEIPLQIVERSGLFKYLDNAGDARIKGIETSVAVRPASFLTLRSSLTWLDARLLNDFDPNNNRPPAKAGDRLPGSPEWTATNTLTGLWFWGANVPTLTLIHRYESESATNLSFKDVQKGDYHLFDLRAGIKRGNFSLNAFCKNLTDERAVTASNNYAQPTGGVLSLKFLAPPRTVGLELGYSFEE